MTEKDPRATGPDTKRKSDREKFYVCPGCGARVDWRDQEEVMRHAKHIPGGG